VDSQCTSLGDICIYREPEKEDKELEAEFEELRKHSWQLYFENVELKARNKQLEHWFHGYKTPEESMYNLVQKLSKAEDTLHFIDGEIRTASPTMDGEPNYRISLDGAKRCKKKLKDYFNKGE
jgi:hypothetical protein